MENIGAFLGICSMVFVIILAGFTQATASKIIDPSSASTPSLDASPVPRYANVTARVSKVIDGDTVVLSTGEKVRLLGINAPEKGKPYNKEATKQTKQLVEGKTVVLERDATDKDRYKRLLRYAYVGDVFVNLQLVREGYANVYIIAPNTKHEDVLRAAWDDCLKGKLNLCRPSENSCGDKCIGVALLNADAEGDDCLNLNDEYVVFRNSCSYPCELTGWTVKDEGIYSPAERWFSALWPMYIGFEYSC